MYSCWKTFGLQASRVAVMPNIYALRPQILYCSPPDLNTMLLGRRTIKILHYQAVTHGRSCQYNINFIVATVTGINQLDFMQHVNSIRHMHAL